MRGRGRSRRVAREGAWKHRVGQTKGRDRGETGQGSRVGTEEEGLGRPLSTAMSPRSLRLAVLLVGSIAFVGTFTFSVVVLTMFLPKPVEQTPQQSEPEDYDDAARRLRGATSTTFAASTASTTPPALSLTAAPRAQQDDYAGDDAPDAGGAAASTAAVNGDDAEWARRLPLLVKQLRQ